MYRFIIGPGRMLTSFVVMNPEFQQGTKVSDEKCFFVSTPTAPKYISLEIQGAGPATIQIVFKLWNLNGLFYQEWAHLVQSTNAPIGYYYKAHDKVHDYDDAVLLVDVEIKTAKITLVAGTKDWFRVCGIEDNQPPKYVRSDD